MLRRQRKLAKKEKRLKEGVKPSSKLERIMRKEERVRRKLDRREKEKVKARLGSVVIKPDTARISR